MSTFWPFPKGFWEAQFKGEQCNYPGQENFKEAHHWSDGINITGRF
jgi:hypothetical protein